MKNFFLTIWGWMKRVWARFRWLIRKPSARQYRVIRCPDMPSLIGMKCFGTPNVNQSIIFTKNVSHGHRIITPATIIQKPNGSKEIYTKHLYIFIKRIK